MTYYLIVGLLLLGSTAAGWLVLFGRPARCEHGVRLRDHCVLCCSDPCHRREDV